MKSTFAALTLVAATSTAALAGGNVVPVEPPVIPPAPPAVAAYNWAGSYLGLSVARPMGSTAWYSDFFDAFADPGDWDGTPVTLTLGHDWQRGRMVFGLALDGTFGDLTSTTTTDNAAFACVGLGNCITGISDAYALRARLGGAFDRLLVYGTAGFASGQVTTSAPLFSPTALESARLNGWTAGVGLSYALSDRFTVGAEYLHTDLGTLTFGPCTTFCSVDANFSTLRLGAALRF